ncbi:MAG TPA: sensor histidine kinase [Acidimicrobiales bacterium]|nr:sensor histidine kinase [Acidimicrobiales bacterium]
MTSPEARQLSDLPDAAREHLERLMGSWGMLADLSFSDLVLYVPAGEEPPAGDGARRGPVSPADDSSVQFLVAGQMRPTTSQTLFGLDLVGDVADEAAEGVLVRDSWRRGEIVVGDCPYSGEAGPVRCECIPVRCEGAIVAILVRVWSPRTGRRTGGLERVYRRIFERLASMVNAGLFPFHTAVAVEDAPRVGDGVIVLDENRRVTFASPNAVNALHRMGIVSAIVGSDFETLGVETDAISTAFSKRLPMIEEIERRPDVGVLVHCIPLVEDDSVVGAAVLLRDVTDLRRRDRLLLSKDAAIREVHHRVKNNLQTISSLLRLQSRRMGPSSGRAALVEAERRVRAIAVVHEVLAREPSAQVPFGEIVPSLVALAGDAVDDATEVVIRVAGDAGDLNADIATPLSLVIAELLQNAVEHAHGGVSSGSLLVDLVFRPGPDRLEVEVRDDGGGFPPGFDLDKTTGLGLSIVRDLVRSQLGGLISVGNDGGAVVRLAIPLAPEVATPV